MSLKSFEFISRSLIQQSENDLLRQCSLVEENNQAEIKVNGNWYVNFSSNDYLGLSQDSRIADALNDGAQKFGTCASASSLITGYNYTHNALEATICEWLNKPKCLLYSSGFAANVGVLSAFADFDTQFLLDKLSHASLIDAIKAHRQQFKRFAHNDYLRLESLLIEIWRKRHLGCY